FPCWVSRSTTNRPTRSCRLRDQTPPKEAIPTSLWLRTNSISPLPPELRRSPRCLPPIRRQMRAPVAASPAARLPIPTQWPCFPAPAGMRPTSSRGGRGGRASALDHVRDDRARNPPSSREAATPPPASVPPVRKGSTEGDSAPAKSPTLH